MLITSECVTAGHPDKLCDIIADSIVDHCLKEDSKSKVACEVAFHVDTIYCLGEITVTGELKIAEIVRNTLKELDYVGTNGHLNYQDMKIEHCVTKQSPEIAEEVYMGKKESEIGAGDQGIMFGYACDETVELFPLGHLLANKLCQELENARKEQRLTWILPYGKVMVTIDYDVKHVLKRVHSIVIICQCMKGVSEEKMKMDLIEKIIKKVVPTKFIDQDPFYYLHPTFDISKGGIKINVGLTGRKIISDSYGGYAPHGGGAFSGKDPTKVDRSGAYLARWIAKSLVAAKLCQRVLLQISFCIGNSNAISIYVNSFHTGIIDDLLLTDVVKNNFILKPYNIITELNLLRPIYKKTASYGHFGRNEKDFTWEVPKKLIIPIQIIPLLPETFSYQ